MSKVEQYGKVNAGLCLRKGVSLGDVGSIYKLKDLKVWRQGEPYGPAEGPFWC